MDVADPGDLRGREHGIITARHIDPDYRKRMEIDDLLTALSEAR